MGIWKEIKTALNSTLGRHTKPLDKIVEEAAYDAYYEGVVYDWYINQDSNTSLIVIPKGQIETGNYEENATVEKVVIPNGTELSDSAFKKCTALKSVSLPKTLKRVPYYAFYACNQLKTIEIPDTVESIGESAFSNCSALQSVIMGTNVKSFDKYAFAFCVALTTIRYKGTMQQWNEISKGDLWNSTSYNYTVYCTDGQIIR
jgi:hypothetical protein